jgi:hypothetical protein
MTSLSACIWDHTGVIKIIALVAWSDGKVHFWGDFE